LLKTVAAGLAKLQHTQNFAQKLDHSEHYWTARNKPSATELQIDYRSMLLL